MGRNVVCSDVCVGGEEGDVLRMLGDIYRCVRGDGYEYINERTGRRVSRDLRFVSCEVDVDGTGLVGAADRTGRTRSTW